MSIYVKSALSNIAVPPSFEQVTQLSSVHPQGFVWSPRIFHNGSDSILSLEVVDPEQPAFARVQDLIGHNVGFKLSKKISNAEPKYGWASVKEWKISGGT